jgi:hypothetical protein
MENRNIKIFQLEYKPNCKNIVVELNLSCFEILRPHIDVGISGINVTAKLDNIFCLSTLENYSICETSEKDILNNLLRSLTLYYESFVFDMANNTIIFHIESENIIAFNRDIKYFFSR